MKANVCHDIEPVNDRRVERIKIRDLKTGKKLWHTKIDKGVAGPACTAEFVIAGSSDGKVYGCELKTGKIKWQSSCGRDQSTMLEAWSQ